MTGTTNLYIAQSPLQIINAAEAAGRYPEAQNVLVVVFKDAERGRTQAEAALALFARGEVIRVTYPKRLRLLKLGTEWRLLRQLRERFAGRVDRLFIGDFRSVLMNYARTSVKPRATYLLDDGTATLLYQDIYFAKGIRFMASRPDRPDRPSLMKRLREMAFRGFYDAATAAAPINLFTVYDIAPLPGQEVLRNSFAHLRARQTAAGGPPQGCYYFGGKYCEADLMTRDDELRFLAAVSADARSRFGEPVHYIPHRGESPEKISAVKAMGFDILVTTVPAEIFLLGLARPPRMVLGAVTSVLRNATEIFGTDHVAAYRIPQHLIKDWARHEIGLIYDSLAARGLSLIEAG